MDEQLTTDGGESTLRRLAMRLLAPLYPGAPEGEHVELFVGRLPDTLPFEAPIPDGATVLGSLRREGQGITIVLDTRLTPEQIRDFYQARMTAAGWSMPEFPGMQGGFSYARPAVGSLFCRSPRGPALEVVTHPVPNAPNDLRIQLTTDARYSPCAQRGRGMDWRSVIPDLAPPPGTRQIMGGGSGGGGSSASSSATIECDRDLAAIAAHYAAQLEQAGWSRSNQGQSGPQAWSTWTFHDEEGQPWTGLFVALQLPERPREYFLQVHANWAEAS